MNILILGGTADARHLCQALYQQLTESESTGAAPNGWQLIYSVAGIVRQPKVPATVISGGFSAFGGLTAYLQQTAIQGIIDATHPYASRIGATARFATQALGIPLWRFLRPAWQAQTGDRWQSFAKRVQLLQSLRAYQRVLLSLGQTTAEELALLNSLDKVYLRTAMQPTVALPANVEWCKAIGPFSVAQERDLFAQTNIQALASKNSGGQSTCAKLQVARELGLPVHMLQRPLDSRQCPHFNKINPLLANVMHWLNQNTNRNPLVATTDVN